MKDPLEYSRDQLARETLAVSKDERNLEVSLDISYQVDVGPAVLRQYFKVVDELHRKERELGILRSEIEFTIRFVERILNDESNATEQVLLRRLRRALNMGSPS